MRLKSDWYYLLGIGLLPLVLLAINNSWVFPPPSWIDPWIYAGYHMHLHRLLADLPWAYYGTRVPWTVLGRIVHHVAGPLVSLELLASLLFYTSALSLFFISIRLFRNAAAAFVAVCLLGTNSWFLLAIGWNYVDGPLVACIFVSLAALTEAATGRFWRLASTAFGIVTAAMLAIYVMNAILLPVYAVLFVLLCDPAKRGRIPVATALASIGFAGCVIAMGVANHLAGGSFDFWSATFDLLGQLTPNGTKDAYYVPWHLWLPAAGWLLIPGSVFLASLAFIVQRRGSLRALLAPAIETGTSNDRYQLAAAIVYVLTVLGFIFMQIDHWVMLSLFFRANTLLPFAYLTIAGFATIYLKRFAGRTQLILASSTLVICLLPFVIGMLGLVQPQVSGQNSNSSNFRTAMASLGTPIEIACTTVGVLSLIGVLLAKNWIPLVLFGALSTFVSVGSMSIYSVVDKTHDASLQDRSLAAFDATAIIDRQGDPVHLWWNERGPDRDIFLSLGSMYLQPVPAPLRPGDRLALLDPGPGWLDAAFAELHRSHLELVNTAHAAVHQGGVSFGLLFGDVAEDPAAFSAHALPLTSMKRTISTGIASEVETPAQPWAYGAILKIPNAAKNATSSQTFAEVTLRVVSGSVGIGVTTLDGRAWIDREFVSASPQPRTVYLSIPSLQSAGDIVICNDGLNMSSIADLKSIKLVYLRRAYQVADKSRHGSIQTDRSRR